ncbi:MAG: hypothetical protein M3Q30_12220 [Actinomycetota bacterium]|nr:hypothetical protein [Actinomycetota bacterium]
MQRTIAVGIIGAALVLAACGTGKSSSSSGSPSENTFVLSEFTIIPPTNVLHAGNVLVTANNIGGEVHELVIVRAAGVGALTKKADGSVDENKIPETDKVGEIDAVAARSRKSATFELRAGTYVAFCNLIDSMMGSSSSMMHGSEMEPATGHVHLAEGMHVTFTVS